MGSRNNTVSLDMEEFQTAGKHLVPAGQPVGCTTPWTTVAVALTTTLRMSLTMMSFGIPLPPSFKSYEEWEMVVKKQYSWMSEDVMKDDICVWKLFAIYRLFDRIPIDEVVNDGNVFRPMRVHILKTLVRKADSDEVKREMWSRNDDATFLIMKITSSPDEYRHSLTRGPCTSLSRCACPDAVSSYSYVFCDCCNIILCPSCQDELCGEKLNQLILQNGPCQRFINSSCGSGTDSGSDADDEEEDDEEMEEDEQEEVYPEDEDETEGNLFVVSEDDELTEEWEEQEVEYFEEHDEIIEEEMEADDSFVDVCTISDCEQ